MSGPAILRAILALTALVCAVVLGVLGWGIIEVSRPGGVYEGFGLMAMGGVLAAGAVGLVVASTVLIRSVLKSGHGKLTNG